MDLANLRVDWVSFLLGAISASLVWFFVFFFARKWLPLARNFALEKLTQIRERNFSGIENYIRQESVSRAQRAHLASRIFALDEILVQPKVICQPQHQDPGHSSSEQTVAAAVFPFLPDWPEIPSQFDLDFISLPEALQKGVNLTITGLPGAGKTVALAHLTTLFGRQASSLGPIASRIPIYLHIFDLLPQASQDLQSLIDPLDLIITALQNHFPVWYQARLPGFIRRSFTQGNAIVLLDGIDELDGTPLQDGLAILDKLKKGYPKVLVLNTASLSQIGELIARDSQIVLLASWNLRERKFFIKQWSEKWNDTLGGEIRRKTQIEPLAPAFVNKWIRPDLLGLTPLEWTLLCWGVTAGDLEKNSSVSAIKTFIMRMLPENNQLRSLGVLASQLTHNRKISFTQADVDSLLNQETLVDNPIANQANPPGAAGGSAGQPGNNRKVSSSLFQEFVRAGLICEHPSHTYRFVHPVIQAYCASIDDEFAYQDWFAEKDTWDAKNLALQYTFAHRPELLTFLPPWLNEEPPLYRNFLLFSRWLRYVPVNQPTRSKVLRRLVEGVSDEHSLWSVRLAFAFSLAVTDESNIRNLFLQMLASQKADFRQIACICLGALQEPKAINPLIACLADPDEFVRRNACLALGIFQDKNALFTLEKCLASDDDNLRQAAAEALAVNVEEGHGILQKATESDNLLVRRAVVFGLAKIKQEWARAFLEQLSLKDSQWVVRNAAAEALEDSQKLKPKIPAPMIEASETPWIIASAARQGLGIAAGDPAVQILLTALHTGTPEERQAALTYLRFIPQENIYQAVLRFATQTDLGINHAAELALWYLTCQKPEFARTLRSSNR